MPEVYKDMNTYKSALSDPQSFYHSNNGKLLNESDVNVLIFSLNTYTCFIIETITLYSMTN